MVKVDPKCLAARRKDGCAFDQKKLHKAVVQGREWRAKHAVGQKVFA